MATDRRPQLEGVAAAFLALTWTTALLRTYVRGFMVKAFMLEDLLALAALFLYTATAAFVLLGISHSMGEHAIEIPIQNLAPAMMYWFSVEIAYVLTTCTLKLSIALFLLRIAMKKSHQIIIYITMTVVTLLTIAYGLFLVFQCQPINYFWNQFTGEKGSCLAPTLVGNMTYVHSAINATADFVLAFLPVVIVSKLKLNPRTKITVSCILSMGIIACAAVIIRIPYVKILVDNAKDFLFSSTDVALWSSVEPGLGITAANLATLRPLFSACLSRSKLFGSSTAKKGASAYGYGNSRRASGGFSASARKGYMRSGSQGGNEELNIGLDDFTSSNTKSVVTTTVEASHPKGRDLRSPLGSHLSTSEEELHARALKWHFEAQQQRIMGDGRVEPWTKSPVKKTTRTEALSGEPSIGRTSSEEGERDGKSAGSSGRRGSGDYGGGGLSPPHYHAK